MNKYLIDTDIWIDLFKERYNLQRKMDSLAAESRYVSEITIAELLTGAIKSQREVDRMKEVIITQKLATVVPISHCIQYYARERARLEKLGIRIEDFDLLIGATAVHYDLVMVTNNTRHYERIQGIRLENWTLPEHNEFIG